MILPKEITKDSDTNTEVASFGYYYGIKAAKERKLDQCTDYGLVFKGSHFIVCCGNVMFAVTPDEFPEIKRRII